MDETKLVAIRVEMPDELRNQFKSVVAREGKNMRDVLLSFIKDYVAERESSQGKGAAWQKHKSKTFTRAWTVLHLRSIHSS